MQEGVLPNHGYKARTEFKARWVLKRREEKGRKKAQKKRYEDEPSSKMIQQPFPGNCARKLVVIYYDHRIIYKHIDTIVAFTQDYSKEGDNGCHVEASREGCQSWFGRTSGPPAGHSFSWVAAWWAPNMMYFDWAQF
ncbi:hypothetical protein [Oryza sativa Japonica Group]|uniref:Uncharacterized protein n=1 Tax=Oryza sativa subsp. japonica TaxID=39947 RepID=Q5QLZ1_ORYSJ|nr:hypothetical protein [Oryza sativa Japonica Group]